MNWPGTSIAKSMDNDFNWRGKPSAFLVRGFTPQRNGLTLSQSATALKDARGETGTVLGMSAAADRRIAQQSGDAK